MRALWKIFWQQVKSAGINLVMNMILLRTGRNVLSIFYFIGNVFWKNGKNHYWEYQRNFSGVVGNRATSGWKIYAAWKYDGTRTAKNITESLVCCVEIVTLIPAYSNNALRRAIKLPRMYFLDTGLCAYLMGWGSAAVLEKCLASDIIPIDRKNWYIPA